MPSTLADALGEGAIVFGTDPAERGIGTAAAKALLGKWKKLAITVDAKSNVHEVHTPGVGYGMANVRIAAKPGGEAYKLNAFVLALPGPADTWSVVGASYGRCSSPTFADPARNSVGKCRDVIHDGS